MQRRTLLKRIGAGGTAAAGVGAVGVTAGPTVEEIVAGEYDDRDWVVNLESESIPLDEFVAQVEDPVAELSRLGVSAITGSSCCCDEAECVCLCCVC